MMSYNDKNIKLFRARFSMDKLDSPPVSLWNISPPVWPGKSKAKITVEQMEEWIKDAYGRSAPAAHLILWMPSSQLHKSMLEPLHMCGPWLPVATILSGSDPLHIGYVYAKVEQATGAKRSWIRWNTKLILDGRGAQGPSSTKTVKFVIDELGDLNGPVVDLFAHRSALLPTWSRRAGLSYIGYTTSRKTYNSITAALAQVELPGIQIETPV